MGGGDRLKSQAEAFEEMISKVPFQYRARESKFSTLNRSPKVEISEEQPPGFSGILLSRWPECPLARKKHKRKVAALREHKDDKNCSIGLLPKKPKLMQPMECPCDDLISEKKLEEESSATNDNDLPSLLTDDSANDLGKNAADEKQDNREFTFWCDTCQIGTFSEIVMESHKIGKKHKRKTKTAALDKQC
uniref:C2H2-type domain-containing protein n=1 Tax=Solanum tuberosum TaxID=4113 RepID=M1D902_SOLTU